MPEDESTVPPLLGPFLGASFLCEKVLLESDGVASVIRIVDRLIHQPLADDPHGAMEPFPHELSLFLMFKAGAARGPMSLEVRLEKPSGESGAPFLQTVNFEGDGDRGINVITKVNASWDMPGLYWFDVLLDGSRVTRIPLRVVYSPRIRQTKTQNE